ncbi:MAG: hypothetical protein JSW60_01310 [Thermoplasmatales archaeon]|nr:MAG: hypothetical protein JSW60_01310 [Thermoplasmatales archaeon]
MRIKKIFVLLVSVMFITAITPVVLAATNDKITVTFDPQGSIDLDVWPETANFSTVTFSTEQNWPQEGATDTTYTLYNNGTVAADVYIFANTTTDSGDMTLNNTGSPSQDEYCLNVTGSNAQQITNTNTSWVNSLAGGGGTVTFGVNLELGSGSTDFGWQKTRINITGALS